MTSLLPRSTTASTGARGAGADLGHRRPLTLIAALGGAVAAASTLVVCLAVGVVGWFLTDAGAHGTSRGGLRVGALGWLLAHGSGISVEGVAVSAAPLGITLLCAWAIWRVGHRVGDSVSGHGPDADGIADGERDWTVPTAWGVFTLGYLAVALVAASLADASAAGASRVRVVEWVVLLCACFGLPAIATGSGRAAIWAAYLPGSVSGAAAACRRILVTWLALAAVCFLAALVLDLGAAANVMSRLHTDAGDSSLIVLLCLVLVPNAVAFSGSYLLGPGFAVGTGTLVSPTVVVLGPLPMFPLLAALPDDGPTPAWTAAVVATARAGGGVRRGAGAAAYAHPALGRGERCAAALAVWRPAWSSGSWRPSAGGAVGTRADAARRGGLVRRAGVTRSRPSAWVG